MMRQHESQRRSLTINIPKKKKKTKIREPQRSEIRLQSKYAVFSFVVCIVWAVPKLLVYSPLGLEKHVNWERGIGRCTIP